ncbi:ATP-binding protein [Amycolatopsis sp. CA-230715]|uniref:ATP-binding protein n=1 Tax=Amycolatopsis sp. CA-230715 TaxID=2745196 RepID=UPI001C331598|nr:BTAD domain-containing putative transcriptional regulator [Amycolatopsis sp. CA-230715]QWF81814.1 hypothetical protein HUW46_05247 [Amycolatopsis sp. CA-230715]
MPRKPGIIRILGPTKIDETPVGGPGLRALLARLALNPGRTIPATTLIDDLYGNTPPEGAPDAIRSQVSRLRKNIAVEFTSTGYRLAIDETQVDATKFENLLAQAKTTNNEALLDEALALWQGPALADITAPFAAPVATRLTELKLTATEDKAEASLARGAPDITTLRELVDHHPLRERAAALLMRALAAQGRQAEALTIFDRTKRALATELGIDPSEDLAAAHLEVLRGNKRRTRLPEPISSLVGRTTELTKLTELLRAARLVTVTGPGGVGKTRLAIEAARSLPGRVWFVELAPTTDIRQAIAGTLGIRDMRRLDAALSEPDTTLVLDNCEHVIEESAAIAEHLLTTCPDLRILTTSREPLDITGERICPLATLDDDASTRLFRERSIPGTDLDPVLLHQVCTALDGLPLAIELAAARTRTLPLDELATRLDDRFTVLAKGARTAEPRHRSLHDVVAWSWELLSDAERTVACGLSVFAGGATPRAVEAVCGDPAELVDKSLVELVGGRYRMLETIRAFCVDHQTDPEPVRRRHAEYFLEFALGKDSDLRGHAQADALAAFRAEHANLVAALTWAVDTDPVLALDLVAALSWYWWLGGIRGEAVPFAVDLLAKFADGPPRDRVEEYLLCVLAAGERAGVHRERGAELLGEPGLRLRRVYILFLWSLSTAPVAVGATPSLPTDPWSVAFGQMGDGLIHLFTGDPRAAEADFGRAVDGFRAVGDRWAVANALDHLAVFARWRGEYDRELAILDEAVESMARFGSAEDAAELRCRHAAALARVGDRDGARAELEVAAVQAGRIGVQRALAHCGLGDLARLDGDLVAATSWYERALAESDEPSVAAEATRSAAFVGLGRIALAEHDTERARSCHEQALAVALRRGNRPVAAAAIEALAEVEQDAARSAMLLGTATAVRGTRWIGNADLDRLAGRVRAELGSARFAALVTAAAARSGEEALTAAVSDRFVLGSPTRPSSPL